MRTTRMEHRRTLALLVSLPASLAPMPLTTALIAFLSGEREKRRWRASTTLKKFATVQGALALLPAYRTAPPIILSQCPLWRQAMRAAGIAARVELPRQPVPATPAEVRKAVSMEKCLPTAAAIILAWATAARVGCVLQLSRDDVTTQADGSLSVRFRRGKGARVRGPYTVHTAPLDPQHLHRLQQWLRSRRASLFGRATTGDKPGPHSAQ